MSDNNESPLDIVTLMKRQGELEYQLRELDKRDKDIADQINRSGHRFATLVSDSRCGIELCFQIHKFKLDELERAMKARRQNIAFAETMADQRERFIDDIQNQLTK